MILDKKHTYTTTTDSKGYYEFNDIPSGTYKIIFHKEGYSDFIFDDYIIIGGGNYRIKIEFNDKNNTEYLRSIHPNIEADNVKMRLSSDTIYFDGEAEPFYSALYFLLSKDKNISNGSFDDWYKTFPNNSLYPNIKSITLDYLREWMLFDANDTIYWIAYANVYKELRFNNISFISNVYFPNRNPKTGMLTSHGLDEEPVARGYIVIPSEYKSAYPAGYVPNAGKNKYRNYLIEGK
jgi:hypothetical protein